MWHVWKYLYNHLIWYHSGKYLTGSCIVYVKLVLFFRDEITHAPRQLSLILHVLQLRCQAQSSRFVQKWASCSKNKVSILATWVFFDFSTETNIVGGILRVLLIPCEKHYLSEVVQAVREEAAGSEPWHAQLFQHFLLQILLLNFHCQYLFLF